VAGALKKPYWVIKKEWFATHPGKCCPGETNFLQGRVIHSINDEIGRCVALVCCFGNDRGGHRLGLSTQFVWFYDVLFLPQQFFGNFVWGDETAYAGYSETEAACGETEGDGYNVA
jgi:hypothetical protein